MKLTYLGLGYFTCFTFLYAKNTLSVAVSISNPRGFCTAGVVGKKVELDVDKCDFLLLEYEAVGETCAELDFANNKLLIKKHMNCTVVAYTRNKEIDRVEFAEAGSIDISFKFGSNTVVEMLENSAQICHSLTIRNPFMRSVGFRYIDERRRKEYITSQLSLSFGTTKNTSLIVRKGRDGFLAKLYICKVPFKAGVLRNFLFLPKLLIN